MGDGLHVDDRHRRILGEAVEDDVLAVVGPVLNFGNARTAMMSQ
jgi:hypothetical protein